MYAEKRRQVRAPRPCEGIGNALRSAYREKLPALPDDMADLLARLS